ncbi:L-asparaginase [Brachybacterium ginsengisoli]|uniref:L-asparaginase n=1 Tax=Brachybacterium ginsengisoli TaxID=1331682 RepID=A0A291H0J9_9MICO|nr:asparaginase [Brachybacterium ginsengisoli]ATG56018.1 L-asparaginase [Brachybacterium ginsengisoli]
MSLPVTLLTLGGTIFMTQGADGGHAAPDAAAGERLASTLIDGVELTAHEIANVSSSDVRPHHLAEVLERARQAVDAGARGVVLTHGTDTLEESAFLLNRYWDREAPLVVTGAMRPASALGADGPSNLHDAVRTAASPQARGAGVLVVFDAHVHLADQVTKASSRSVSAFASAPSGPLAIVDGAELRLLQLVPERVARRTGSPTEHLPAVPALMAGLDEDLDLLDHLPEGTLAGLVIAGVGMGHVSPVAMPRLRRLLEAGVPVVVATRIASGGTSTHHYAYPGSEVDLLEAGAIMAGHLPPAKARLLLQALLAEDATAGTIREEFAAYAS